MKPLYRPLDWVMVRTPLLPVQEYLALGAGAQRVDPDALPGVGPTVPGSSLPADPRVQRALAIGAGDLFRALEKPPKPGKSAERSSGSLLRYLIRMSTRPTPYGSFAGVALAHWGSRTDLALDAAQPRIRTRPDMGWLLGLVADLERRPEVRASLQWFANQAVCLRADRVFLAERAVIDDAPEAARAVNLRATPAVRRALELARTPIPYADLVDGLAAGGAPLAKVERLVTQLWEQTLLLSDLRPPLTVAEPARYVAERLRGVPAARAEADALAELLDEIAGWDALDDAQAAARHSKLIAKARSVQDTDVVPFQTDMALRLGGSSVNELVASEAARLADLLIRLAPAPRSPLDKYRQAFEERYGPDREVPLLELLDPGLGLGAPELDVHDTPPPRPERDRTLLALAVNAIKDDRLTVELDAATLTKLQTQPNGSGTPTKAAAGAASARVAESMDLSVFVVAESAQAVDSGDFQLVLGPNLGSGAAGRVLGRFADLIGEPAIDALRSAADAETQVDPAVLRTEVSYLPRQARLANVAIRPLVRKHELTFGTTPSNRLEEQVLRADELTVRLSHGRFVVRSSSAARDIAPTAGHMLNTLGAPPIVRFLDQVSWDGITFSGGFDWGPAKVFPFVPRVQSGRLVLAPATWRLEAGAVDAASPDEFATAFGDWRERWRLPQYVYLAMADNRLLLDLDVPEQVGQIWAQYRKLENGQPVVVQEALPSPQHAWVTGPHGNYLSELVVPLVLAEPRPEQPQQPVRRIATARSTKSVAAGGSVSRSRPPGSDWLYAKLYHLPTYEDDLIAGPIRTFGAEALTAGADSWHFLRYADPEPHLRIRWQGDPDLLSRHIAPQLLAWGNELTTGGYVRRFLLDTYDQEVERYGGPTGIEPAEGLFATDSHAVAQLLWLRTSRHLDLGRSLLAAITVERLLTALGLDREQRTRHYRDRLQDRKLTSEEFRREQNTLRSAIGDPNWLASQPGGPEAVAILDDWAERITDSALAFEAAGLTHTTEELAHSFVHMHCNRLVGCGHPYEQRVLGLLDRTTESLRRAPCR